jgi:hypothetical protein
MKVIVLLVSFLCTGCGALPFIADALPTLFGISTKPELKFDPTRETGNRDDPKGAYVVEYQGGPLELGIDTHNFIKAGETLTEFMQSAEFMVYDSFGEFYGDFLSEDLFHLLQFEITDDTIHFTLRAEDVSEILGKRRYFVHTKCFGENFDYQLEMVEPLNCCN